jgi:divalent metal cation (Fe/Co/Zn/Cd) transporter
LIAWRKASGASLQKHFTWPVVSGLAFGILAVALAVAGINDLASGRRAGESFWGIAYLAVTAVVMFSLAVTKRTTALALGSEPLHSEATVTFLDGILSTSTLIGLALNAYLGLWWADPVAGLLVAVAAASEGRETWLEAAELEAETSPGHRPAR